MLCFSALTISDSSSALSTLRLSATGPAGNAVSEGKGDEVEVALLLMPLVLRYATVSEETLTKP
jgi:hypothetical protein